MDVSIPQAGEQIFDVSVPQIRKDIGEVIHLIPQERISDRVVEQIIDIPVPQIREPRAARRSFLMSTCNSAQRSRA